MEKIFLSIDSLDKPVRVIKRDLANQYGVDATAFMVMECMADKISPELWNLLYAMLLPFDCDMQLEMVDDLLDFAHGYVIHTTGCPSADAVLEVCYRWIAEERGLTEFAEKIKLYKF